MRYETELMRDLDVLLATHLKSNPNIHETSVAVALALIGLHLGMDDSEDVNVIAENITRQVKQIINTMTP